jgi:hypothetical protein
MKRGEFGAESHRIRPWDRCGREKEKSMKNRLAAVVLIAFVQLAGCGGGGGYQVAISGQPTINVPYVSGLTAPTSTVTTLSTGTYTVTVRAYAALDVQGGSAGSLSAPSQSLIVNVP